MVTCGIYKPSETQITPKVEALGYVSMACYLDVGRGWRPVKIKSETDEEKVRETCRMRREGVIWEWWSKMTTHAVDLVSFLDEYLYQMT